MTHSEIKPSNGPISAENEPGGDSVDRPVRLSGKKLIEYRKQLLIEMEKATGAMQDHAERLGDPKYPTAEADLKASAMRYQRAVIAHMRTIAKSSVDICLPNTPHQARTTNGSELAG